MPMLARLQEKNRPHYLMISLFLLLLLWPAFTDRTLARLVGGVLFTLVLLSAALSVARSKRLLIAVAVLGIPPITLQWVAGLVHFGPYSGKILRGLSDGTTVVFMLAIFTILLADIMTVRRVSGQTLCRAVSGYIILGQAWGVMYRLVTLINPHSLRSATGSETNVGDYTYFSFTVLTTLGFGDITPTTNYARSLVTVQSIVGPLYLTILVARLVALYSTAGRADALQAASESKASSSSHQDD